MNTKQFAEAMGGINDRYIEKAVSYQAKSIPISRARRRIPAPLVAAILAMLLISTAVAANRIYNDLWIQKPSNDPVRSVRAALENQADKDYTIRIEVISVEIDEAETARTVQRYLDTPIAERNGWSGAYLAEHFLAVKAVYYAEYDHTQTPRDDGEVAMYFYLVQDVDSGEWRIWDNSGNVNRAEDDPTGEGGAAVAGSAEEQLFSYLSELFNGAYSLYYDGLHYEMNAYAETTDGDNVTATFLWTMYFLGKRWDIATDEGVEQEANFFLQATAIVGEDGVLDPETISVLADTSAVGAPNYSDPIEEYFPS